MIEKKYWLSILLVVQIIVLQIVSLFPNFVETYYSNGIYPLISVTLRFTFGFFPFSVGDILYGIFLFLTIRMLWRLRKNRKDFVLALFNVISIFYFFFHFLWAVNYHRIPLYEKLNIEREYSSEQLEDFAFKLIEKTNSIHRTITGKDSIKVVNPYSEKEIFEKSIESYHNLNKIFPYLNYKTPSIKTSLISTPLSYMGFSGYLNPFTNEAHVNKHIPKYNFPTTTLHEMTHQLGIASESEANFIGFLASVHSSDIYIQYSGYVFALKYCLRNLDLTDEENQEKFLSAINPGILENIDESRQFQEKYSTVLEYFFEWFYDYFLKFNQQKDGIKGYNNFIGLMINYYQSSAIISTSNNHNFLFIKNHDF